MSNPEYAQEERPVPPEEQIKSVVDEALGSPIDYPPGLRAFVEDLIRQNTLTKAAILSAVYPTGFPRVVFKDFSAQTGLYVHEDNSGLWVYLNGATLTTDYQDLIDYLGTTTLPDTRGRALWMTGTHVDLDLFDSDGQNEPNRTPRHQHTDTIDISGTVSGTFASSAHTHGAGTYAVNVSGSAVANGGPIVCGSAITHAVNGTSGSPSATASVTENLSIVGSVGSGLNAGNAVAYSAIGSLCIRP